ncbi:hypothetical protein A7U60_g7194 [Sanghuangporus baumii]|uniref:CBM1 domain-containing protein n=1 Tax=Sanghuangporus baumii TaxID=108892 RepID=A0A9Q5HTS0_SANBA|nr:hypothetical protein A7U60_g7194 [Sanghuangporus baumii]
MILETSLVFAVLYSAQLASAQQSVWGQCGGINWTGPTTCDSGSTCIRQNDCDYIGSSEHREFDHRNRVRNDGGLANFNWYWISDFLVQLTGFDPTGELPSVGNPLGNPPYPGWTAVGGTNWIDLMTVEFNKSLVLTYNYAYGGATIGATKPSTGPWTSDNALFSFWIGINDIGNSYYQSGDRDAETDFRTLSLTHTLHSFKRSSAAVGGRNFLFVNVPPIDRSPLMLQQSADARNLEKTGITGYNSKLAARATQLKANNTGVQTSVWDSNTAFTVILDNPTSFGFVDATSYGGTGSFWGNDYHPSSAANTIFGQNVSTVLSGTIW